MFAQPINISTVFSFRSIHRLLLFNQTKFVAVYVPKLAQFALIRQASLLTKEGANSHERATLFLSNLWGPRRGH